MGRLQDLWATLTGIPAGNTNSIGVANAAPSASAVQTRADRWLDDLPSDAVRRSVMAALSREAAASTADTPYEPRHQLGIAMGYRPVKADVPAAIVRRDAFFTDPWWHRSEVGKPVANIAAASGDHYTILPDGSRIVSENRYPFRLLDGRHVVQVRRVLLTPQAQRRKEFALYEIGPDDKQGKPISLAEIAAALPLFGLDGIDPKQQKTIVVAEGVIAAEALRRNGFASCGTLTGALHTPPHAALAPLAIFQTIFLWPDNDAIGVRHMERIAHRLSSLGAKDIRVVRWIGGPRKGDAADFRDGETGIRDLLEKARPWKPVNRVRNRGHLAINIRHAPGSLTLPLGKRPAHLTEEPFARKPSAFRTFSFEGDDNDDAGMVATDSTTEPRNDR